MLAVIAALAVAAVSLAGSVASGAGTPSGETKLEIGKRLYRKYCGQCHALRAANAAGFGSQKLGQEGGPSFNELRVPFALSVSLMTQSSAGHERVVRHLKWAEIRDVAAFIASATKRNAVLAQPIDG
jgi:mono/diheme cytochrome c family protein